MGRCYHRRLSCWYAYGHPILTTGVLAAPDGQEHLFLGEPLTGAVRAWQWDNFHLLPNPKSLNNRRAHCAARPPQPQVPPKRRARPHRNESQQAPHLQGLPLTSGPSTHALISRFHRDSATRHGRAISLRADDLHARLTGGPLQGAHPACARRGSGPLAPSFPEALPD